MTTVERDLSVESTFDSLNPATGEVIGTFPVHGEDEVDAAVRRARDGRRVVARPGLRRPQAPAARPSRRRIATRQDELCELIHRETGKPVDDARIELVLAIDHLDWAYAPRREGAAAGARRADDR